MRESIPESSITITVNLSGTLTIARSDMERLLRSHASVAVPSPAGAIANREDERLAFTMQETAKILGISYISVHRLLKRGLLKRSLALRRIVIPKREIERFLQDTMGVEV
jgi:hypothetical protein